MTRAPLLQALCGAGLSLLLVHEIDSAYWEEWDLFHLPGGIRLFLALHMLAVPAALLGFRQVVLGGRGAHLVLALVAAAGVFTFGIHMAFLARGHGEFRDAVSVAVLAA